MPPPQSRALYKMLMAFDVLKQRRDGKDQLPVPISERLPEAFHRLSKIAGEQIVFVLIVCVKRGAAHVGPIANILHRDGVVALFLNQRDERVRQGLPGALRAAIGCGVFGQMRCFVHYGTISRA